MVFQSYALYPHMSVRQNLAFGLENTRMPRAEIDARIAEAARMLDIERLLERRPGQLSGGQRQRVAIGRAIVRRPVAFLLDEPLSNLDAELRVSTRAELAALHARLKATMIYVTHDQVEAMTLADRIVVLRAGRIEQIGTPLELYNHPANRFVAGFIGAPHMNFLNASVTEVRDGAAEVALDGGPRIAVPLEAPVAPGTRLAVGVRPQHVTLANGDGIPGRRPPFGGARLGDGRSRGNRRPEDACRHPRPAPSRGRRPGPPLFRRRPAARLRRGRPAPVAAPKHVNEC